jgi:hypothetical protein
MVRLPVLVVLALLLGACATAPPVHPGDLCAIFQEKSGWYKAARASQTRWGTSIPVMMSTMYQESRFVSDARPPRRYYLGFIPGGRLSDAYGYPQAKDAAWDNYVSKAGRFGSDRDDFADAIDFIGWYFHGSYQIDGIERDDAYNLYLSYHQGQQAFARHAPVQKSWAATAQQVATRSRQYAQQLKTCVDALEKDASSWF